MKRIDEVEQPEVGRFYLVPCIKNPVFKRSRVCCWGRYQHLPIIGPWHEDAEIVGFAQWHFHYDWRFMPSAIYNLKGPMSHARPATRFPGEPYDDAFQVTEMKRKMIRQMPEFPSHGTNLEPVQFVARLEEHFSNHKLTCRICPHKGMPLHGLPEDENGNVVCPGHGLRWNLKTGELRPRLSNPKITLASSGKL